MDSMKKQDCPQCKGNKIIEGTCECNMEWRGNQLGEDWEDCRCTPDVTCPTCKGKGYMDPSKGSFEN